jgi:Flp pilus assembly protein TadD
MTAPSLDRQRVRLLVESGRWAEVVTAVAPVIAAFPDDPEPLCQLAQAQLGLNRPHEALAAAHRARGVDPESTWAVRVEAAAHNGLGRCAQARLLARWVVAREPEGWRGWLLLSQAARGCGQGALPEAIDAAGRALALDPGQPPSLLALGSALLAAGDLFGARSSFARALTLDPANSAAQNGLGQVALKLSDPVEAANRFGRSLLADPRQQVARRNLRLPLLRLLLPVPPLLFAGAYLAAVLTISDTGSLGGRVGGVVVAVVVNAVLAGYGAIRLRALDPPTRRFYRRLVRRDRRLSIGCGLLALADLGLIAVAAMPRAAIGWWCAVMLGCVAAAWFVLFPRRFLLRRLVR